LAVDFDSSSVFSVLIDFRVQMYFQHPHLNAHKVSLFQHFFIHFLSFGKLYLSTTAADLPAAAPSLPLSTKRFAPEC
jgi:hypothetical protein